MAGTLSRREAVAADGRRAMTDDRSDGGSQAGGTYLRFLKRDEILVVKFVRTALPEVIDDSLVCGQLADAIRGTGCQSVQFHVAGIDHMSSGWLTVLVQPLRLGLEVRLVNPTAFLAGILRSTGLASLVTIENDEAAH